MAITMMRDMTMSGLEKGKGCETEEDKAHVMSFYAALLCFHVL